MTIKEYEDKIYKYADFFRRKIASNDAFNESLFTEFVKCVCEYSEVCIKIAETKVYNYLTIKSAKDAHEKFKMLLGYLNAMIRQINHEVKGIEDTKNMMKNFLMLKLEFEKIVSCCDNYLLKKNGRYYDFIQDDSTNKTCILILRLFEMMSKFLKSNKSFGSFVMDLERMKKRYDYFNHVKTFDLEDADVVGK